PARPFLRLRLEDHMIRIGPADRVDAGKLFVILLVVPELLAFAGCDVGNPEREGVAAAELGVVETRTVIARAFVGLRSTASSAATTTTSTSTIAQRVQRVVRRTVRIADAALPLVRLFTERSARASDEGDARAVW